MATKNYIVLKGDIVDNLTTEESEKPLSAKQGMVLKNALDQIPSPTGTLKDNVCAVYKDGGWKLSPDYGYMDSTNIVDGSVTIVEASETGTYHWYSIGNTIVTPVVGKVGTILITIPGEGSINFSYNIWESEIESGVYYIGDNIDNENPGLDDDNPVAAKIDTNIGVVYGAAIAELTANVKLDMINSVDTFNEQYIPEIEMDKVKGLKSKFSECVSATPMTDNDGLVYSSDDGKWVSTRRYGRAHYGPMYNDTLTSTVESETGSINWEEQEGKYLLEHPNDGDIAVVISDVYGYRFVDVFTITGDNEHLYIGIKDSLGRVVISLAECPFALRVNTSTGVVEYASCEIQSYDAKIEYSYKVDKFWKGYIPTIDISMVEDLQTTLNKKASTTDLSTRQPTADRLTAWQTTPDTTHYPCEKLVKDSLNEKEPTIVHKNTAFNKNFGTTSDTVCEGNDSRLSDSRTPTAHATTHGNSGTDRVTIDSSQIVSGVIDASHVPAGSFQKLITVADEAARKALTSAEVSKGDTVKQNDTGVMYFCIDITKLATDEGWMVYTAITNWDSVSDKPSSFVPTTHASTHDIGGTDAITTASSTAGGLLSKDDWSTFNSKQPEHIATAIKLNSSDWDSSKQQTVAISGVTASNTVFVSPEPSSVTVYGLANVICVSQGEDKLTFQCTTIPALNITVNVVILN